MRVGECDGKERILEMLHRAKGTFTIAQGQDPWAEKAVVAIVRSD